MRKKILIGICLLLIGLVGLPACSMGHSQYQNVTVDDLYRNAINLLWNPGGEYRVDYNNDGVYDECVTMSLSGWQLDPKVSFRAVLNQYELKPAHNSDGMFIGHNLIVKLGERNEVVRFYSQESGEREVVEAPAYIQASDLVYPEDLARVQKLMESKIGKEVHVEGQVINLLLEGITSWPKSDDDYRNITALVIRVSGHRIAGYSSWDTYFQKHKED